MKKEITAMDVANGIINSGNVSFEDEGGARGEVTYYVHIKVNDDGEVEFVNAYYNADETFTEPADISEWAGDEGPDRLYEEFETVDNPDFMRMCDRFADQINEYLEENAVEEDRKPKYIVVDERRDGQVFTEEFDNLWAAIKSADDEWYRRTEHDKRNTSAFYVLESANPDEDADDHFDGNPILVLK